MNKLYFTMVVEQTQGIFSSSLRERESVCVRSFTIVQIDDSMRKPHKARKSDFNANGVNNAIANRINSYQSSIYMYTTEMIKTDNRIKHSSKSPRL